MINPRIIIIGGNAAGPAAAAKAKRTNPDAEVIMYEAGEFISTGTCEIPYALSGEIKDVKEIVNFDADEFYYKKGVKVHTQHLVEKIDPTKKLLYIRQLRGNRFHEVKYDKLVLSTGSFPKSIGFNAPNLFTMKNVKDLIAVKEYCNSYKIKDILIIGAGFIGIESAEAFKTLGYNVTIIDHNEKPLSSSEPEIQSLIAKKLEDKGIYFYKGVSLKPIYSGEKIVSINVDGRIIESDIVISAIGFVPNTILADQLKIRKGETGAVKVDRFMKTSVPDVYSAGDLIEVTEKVSGRGIYIPLANLAHDSGHIAGDNAAGGQSYMESFVKNISVKIFDKFYATVGLTSHEARKFNLFYESVDSIERNYNKSIPGNEKVFGKLIFNKSSKKIIGASFLGGREVEGYANVISSLILMNQTVDVLTKINYTYTPPLSQMKNMLSSLGWKTR